MPNVTTLVYEVPPLALCISFAGVAVSTGLASNSLRFPRHQSLPSRHPRCSQCSSARQPGGLFHLFQRPHRDPPIGCHSLFHRRQNCFLSTFRGPHHRFRLFRSRARPGSASRSCRKAATGALPRRACPRPAVPLHVRAFHERRREGPPRSTTARRPYPHHRQRLHCPMEPATRTPQSQPISPHPYGKVLRLASPLLPCRHRWHD